MKRRVFLASLLAMAVVPRTAAAQGAAKVVRIGWLTAQQASSLVPYVDAMRTALADLGYVEGRNLVIEFRYGDDLIERVPELAAELVRLPVDLIVAQGAAAFEIRGLGLPIPIVYSMSADPVSAGFADSLARPRGNMTGVTLMAVEFNGKRLELLQEIVPELRRVAVVGNPEHPGSHLERAFSEETARRLGLTIEYLPTRMRDELTSVLSAISAHPPQPPYLRMALQSRTGKSSSISPCATARRSFLAARSSPGAVQFAHMGRASPSPTGGWHTILTGFSRARSPPTFPSSGRQSSSL